MAALTVELQDFVLADTEEIGGVAAVLWFELVDGGIWIVGHAVNDGPRAGFREGVVPLLVAALEHVARVGQVVGRVRKKREGCVDAGTVGTGEDTAILCDQLHGKFGGGRVLLWRCCSLGG